MQAAICAETGRLRRRARGVVQPRAMIAGMEARFVTRIGIVLALCGVLLGVQGCVAGAEEAVRFGPQATESAPDRRQAWAIPVPAPVMAARAVLFRPPPGAGPIPLAVIAHASVQSPLRRAELPQPDHPQLSALWWPSALRCWCRSGRRMA